MSEPLLLKFLDLAFRISASEFHIEAQSQTVPGQRNSMNRPSPQEIPSSLLQKYGPEGIVAVLKEFSFPETLNLIKSLNRDARAYILDSLQEHHDLKAALEFGLQYEEEHETEDAAMKSNEDVVLAEICSLFLKRLSEWSDEKFSQRQKAI